MAIRPRKKGQGRRQALLGWESTDQLVEAHLTKAKSRTVSPEAQCRIHI
jgi:hypothetical protein